MEKNLKDCFIYQLINKITGEIYIGQTNNLNRRISKYKNLLCKQQKLIYESIVAVGWNNFEVRLITVCKVHEVDYLEIYYMEYFQSYYKDSPLGLNMTKTKRGTFKGQKHTEEWKRNLSARNKGIGLGTKRSKEIIQKIKDNHFCLGKFGKDHFRSIPVHKYSLDGSYIESFAGLSEAGRFSNCPASSIGHAIKRKDSCKDFYWSKLKLEYFNPKEKQRVFQYDLDGNFLKMWPNLTLMSKETGFHYQSLYSALKNREGKYKTYILTSGKPIDM